MRARNSETFPTYARVLREDPSEYDRLIATLTINVTSFFRDPATYDCLAARVLPAVWPTNASGMLRVWSAGCSTGEEVYSLSMLMHDHANRNGVRRSLRQVRIVGSEEALFSRFHDLLLPGGFLVLGKVETLLGQSRDMFAPVSSRERIFKRL